VYAHISWIMMNLERHLGTPHDFESWLTTMWTFYLGNRILGFEERIGLLPELHRRAARTSGRAKTEALAQLAEAL
jgi:hypothetical protein